MDEYGPLANSSTSSRREFLRGSSAAVASWLISPPAVHASKNDFVLRVLGTDVTLREDIRRQAEKDLGFRIRFEPGGSATVLQKASMRPETFDVYEQWSNSINILWQANAIQPISKDRIARWNEINSLTKSGKLTPDMPIGAGDAPHKLLHVQADDSLGADDSPQISFVPYVHNVDSFGYNTSIVPQGIPYETESWGWLLDNRFHGRVGVVNEPAIGIFDLALAAQSRRLIEFADIGNLTRIEVDQLFEILMDYKLRGHFSGLWNSVPQSVSFMKSGRVVIESMFSPAASTLNGLGIPVTYAAPREGYRGWHGVLCLSSKTSGRAKDAAYAYMNWWLEGWAGAYMARQGYYIAIPERARDYLSPGEWSYWYEGKPAPHHLTDADGRIAVRAGAARTGGSYLNRFSRVAVWNTVMDSYEYSLVRWYELLTT
ncbi:ABC transporter substrate-binding protein [Rubinisphaera margarita]|uniref:ABC transporter substrate-binding protein n=1 Tax=Rubinisphaera margarita TaxID=2909586 RepID=UPI001EE9A808|nr:extracellular solute-binding protein [Rubinisphaera margarita]MCG6155894.1 extracellular solute-binding protein [Rubinisphaera margarita]